MNNIEFRTLILATILKEKIRIILDKYYLNTKDRIKQINIYLTLSIQRIHIEFTNSPTSRNISNNRKELGKKIKKIYNKIVLSSIFLCLTFTVNNIENKCNLDLIDTNNQHGY